MYANMNYPDELTTFNLKEKTHTSSKNSGSLNETHKNSSLNLMRINLMIINSLIFPGQETTYKIDRNDEDSQDLKALFNKKKKKIEENSSLNEDRTEKIKGAPYK